MTNFDISDLALSSIVSYTLEDIPHVVGLSNRNVATIINIKKTKPLRIVRQDDNTLSVDLAIGVEYGYNVRELAATTQKAVAEALILNTGMNVSAVHITVATVVSEAPKPAAD